MSYGLRDGTKWSCNLTMCISRSVAYLPPRCRSSGLLFLSAIITFLRTLSESRSFAGLTPRPSPFKRNIDAVVMCKNVRMEQKRRTPSLKSFMAIFRVVKALSMTSCTCEKSVGVRMKGADGEGMLFDSRSDRETMAWRPSENACILVLWYSNTRRSACVDSQSMVGVSHHSYILESRLTY